MLSCIKKLRIPRSAPAVCLPPVAASQATLPLVASADARLAMVNFDQLLANEEQYLLAEQQELARTCEEAFKELQVLPRPLHTWRCRCSTGSSAMPAAASAGCRCCAGCVWQGHQSTLELLPTPTHRHMHAGAACGGHAEGGASGHRQQGQGGRGAVPQGRRASGGLARAAC